MHDYPLRMLFWETTAACNLTCRHCRRLDLNSTPSSDDLTTKEGRRLIDDIASRFQPIFVLSGGEPLIRPDWEELARYAVSKALPVALATNGTLITSSVADCICASGIRRVSVSFDGADAKTHDTFRQMPGSFDQALRGLRLLKERGMSLQINSTLTQFNIGELDRLHQFALDEGVNAFHLFMLVPVGCGAKIALDQQLSGEQYERVLNWLADKSREGRLHIRATCAPHAFRVRAQRAKQDGVRLADEQKGMEARTKGCLAGSAICFVSHKGDVFPCGYLPLNCGNVRTQSLTEIWADASIFQKLRHPELLRGKCGVCEYRKVCSGCRARAWVHTADFMAEEPFCTYQPAEKVKSER